MNKDKVSLQLHKKLKGKIEIISRVAVKDANDHSIVSSPGVAAPCLEIAKDSKLSYTYTRRHNIIAVVTDGSAVLGLGNIGPEAAMPVMEGKSILFKSLADVDAVPLCLNTQNTKDIIKTILLLAPSFGAINLEDISAPRCFEIMSALKKTCPIPVFHDDQHGTAIVVISGLINALKLVNKQFSNVKIVINGAGAAGTTIIDFLLELGVANLLVCDKEGILVKSNTSLIGHHRKIAEKTNPLNIHGSLGDAIVDADVFIGVSVANCVTKKMVESMKKRAIVFALANPHPEITVKDAHKAGAYIVGTGSSEHPNQINNLLAFPGILRGTLDSHAKTITNDMMFAASLAIANMIPEKELTPKYIICDPLDKKVHQKVAQAVMNQARLSKTPKTHT